MLGLLDGGLGVARPSDSAQSASSSAAACARNVPAKMHGILSVNAYLHHRND